MSQCVCEVGRLIPSWDEETEAHRKVTVLVNVRGDFESKVGSLTPRNTGCSPNLPDLLPGRSKAVELVG